MYKAIDYSHLIGLPGFSDILLTNHFTLYQGYVKNVNTLSDLLDELTAAGKNNTPQFAEAKRRFGWEFNGMRLHELYFDNLTKDAKPLDLKSPLALQLTRDFGDYLAWEKEFQATGALRGVGWAVLAYDPAGQRTFNICVNEHDVGLLAGAKPLLVLDVFEHAYMLDFGLKRADYIAAFFKAIDWTDAEKRFAAV